jgi:hypothetical protein
MARFLDVLCEDKMGSLIITGKATDQQLGEAWVLILAEYYELRGDTIDTVEEWSLGRDIQKLQSHLSILDTCVQFLAKRYSDSIAESVRRLGYSFRPTSYNPIDYLPLLNTIFNKSKLKYVQLKQLIKQLEEKMKVAGKEKPKRDYFEKMIIEIEEMQRTNYDLDVLPVSKYVQLEKKYWQKVEQLKKAHVRTH